MTAVAITGWGAMPRVWQVHQTDTFTALDATTDYVAWVVRAPATGTIDKVYIRVGTTTLSGTLSVQIQTLDSAGDPSGTAYGSCAQSDVAVTGTEDNTWVTFPSLACSATAGDYICVRVWASTVTSGSANIMAPTGASTPEPLGFPYLTTRTTGSGAGTHASVHSGPTIEYSGAVFYETGLPPMATIATEYIDSDGSIRKLGNRFILPVPVTAIGIWAIIDNDTDTTLLKLWDTNGTTALATATLVSANRGATSSRIQYALFDSGTAVNLSANTASAYRVAAETNNTSATACGVLVHTVSSSTWLGMLPLGASCHYSSHNGTSWSETTTKRCAMGLIVSKLDDGNGFGRAQMLLGGLN